MLSEDWLIKINQEFMDKKIPHRHRAFEAYRRMCLEVVDAALNSDEANYLFDWFEKNTKEGSDKIKCLYRFPFLFDGEFWILTIPSVAGSMPLKNIEKYLELPITLKEKLVESKESYNELESCFFVCINYIYVFNDSIKKLENDLDTIEWLKSADFELRTAIEIILRDNNVLSRSVLNLRNAFENFLKALIFYEYRLTTKQFKNDYGHDLDKAFNEVVRITNSKELMCFKEIIKIFPRVEDRYKQITIDKIDISKILLCTQIIALHISLFIYQSINKRKK